MRRYAPLVVASLLLFVTGACETDTAEEPDTTIQTQPTTTVETTTTAAGEGSTSTTARPLIDPDLEVSFVEFVKDSWDRSGRNHGGEVPDLTWKEILDVGRAICEHLVTDPTAVSRRASMESFAQVAALIADHLGLVYDPALLDAGFESRRDSSLVTAFKHTGNRGVDSGVLCPQFDIDSTADQYVGRMFLSPWSVNAVESATSSPAEVQPVIVVGPDGGEGDGLAAELSTAAAGEGFEVIYNQYLDLDDLVNLISGDDPPDVIIVPFPGFLSGVAGHLVDLVEIIEPSELHEVFGDYLIDSAKDPNGAVLGAPIRVASLKTLVWYKPAEFDEHGYEIPATFAELVALSDRMVADGETPWCNYIGSDAATGWVGTDWVEDLLLGAEGSTVYDGWVDHSVLFTDARVEAAFERYMGMVDTPGYVYDWANMLTRSFRDNASPLDAGDCLMHRQAAVFRWHLDMAGADLDDFSTFKFPSVDPELSEATIGGATYVAALNDRKEVEKLIDFMLSDKFGEAALAPSGNWLLPHTRFDHSLYSNELVRSWADIIREGILADLFRFDAADRMPGEVGAGSFWSGIVNLVAGTKTIPQVLADIDTSWPE